MKKLLFLFFPCMLFAQENRISGEEETQSLEIELLTDRNYTIEQVVNDSSVVFQKDLTLKDYETNTAYWIKSTLTNTSDRYSEYYFDAFPFLDNTYYYFDQKQDKWITLKGGLSAKEATGRLGIVKIGFYPNQTTDLYIKANVEKFSGQSYNTTASLWTYKAAYIDQRAQQTYMYWLITTVAIGLFFIFNGYVYLMFRDRAYLYYLAILVSGMLYLTSITGLVHRFVPIRFFQVKICDDNNMVCSFDFNVFVLQISIALVIGFFIAFTREFLQTRIILPKWDRFLKYAGSIFVSYMVLSSVVTQSGLLFLKTPESVFVENIVIAVIICFLMASGVMAHRKNFKPAKYFLIANSVQLVIMAALAVYLIVYKEYGNNATFLPHTALLIQALTFAVSLVARISSLKEELRAKKEESIRLQSHNEQMVLREQLMELEKQKLQEESDFKTRQLTATTMHLYNKNEILSELQTQIKKIPKSETPDVVITQIKRTINNNMYIDADWEKFKLHFEQVHPDFFKKLDKNHPDLTAYEVRLCAYLHLQLSTKEIATLLNIEPESVRKAKMRLKKKMEREVL
ncbi:MAG: 7TM diverse intracellular signaling domain-containing protein [Flavobacteriaceae bacterium]